VYDQKLKGQIIDFTVVEQ